LVQRAECGLGHAAVQLARWAGARVLATAATAEAREALQRSGIEHVSDSESLQFQRDTLAWTEGRGVDLVLNTLAGDLRAASFDCLARGGTLVDALPPGQHDALALPHSATALRYFRYDRAAWLADEPERARALQELAARYRAGEARPLAVRAFPACSLHAALEELQRAKPGAPLLLDLQQGPVTLAARLRKPLVRPDASYIVTGGFGGVGLASLSWLARQGARSIAVLSRSGPRSAAARETVRALRAAGVQLSHRELDIGNGPALAAALRSLRAELPPVRGVLHGAAVLADAEHEHLSDDDVVRVMSAKAGGGLHLHEQLADAELDFFVCHGSISGAFGNARQFNYAGANGFARGLCAWRRSQGLPATCLDWGPIAGTGMLSEASNSEAWLSRLGLLPLAIERVFETLEEALDKDWGAVIAADIDWSRWLAQLPPRLLARFSLVQPESDQSGASAARSLRGQLLALPPPERSALLLRRTSEVAAQVLAMHQSRIDASSRLQDLGIDSLMAQEMSQALYERTGVRLRTLYMARGPSLAEVADLLVDGILCNEAAA
jgi:NADPH:quinone reductase-like Zn-dependent oxidoreductase